MAQRILIVDDEPEVRRILERLLVAQGFQVAALGTAAELHARLRVAQPDLLILDRDLGGDDGVSLAREVRRRSALPILMLTGHGTAFDKVSGLEAGADDYLTKPFDGHELLARVRALLRRAAVVTVAPAPAQRWRFAGWRLDETARGLHAPDGTAVALTGHEFELLLALVRCAGQPIARDALGERLTGRRPRPDDRSIDVRVTKLRQKLAAHGGAALIKTLRGRGYLLAAPAEPDAAAAPEP